MGYFDPLKQTEQYVNASPVGLGAILSQATLGNNNRTILAYASLAFEPTSELTIPELKGKGSWNCIWCKTFSSVFVWM